MSVLEALKDALGPSQVSTEEVELRAVARDMWPRALLLDLEDKLGSRPSAVAWPESDEDVAKVIRVARAHRVPLVPYGAGSGVVGGATSPQGGIVLDMKRMSRVISLDRESWLVTVEAGIIGEVLERHLAAHGATLSHFPSSIYCSSIGGWIAARSSGQLSTRYGSIERRLAGLDAVLGTGELLSIAPCPRSAAGPDLLGLFCGSEGALGVITRATLRAHPVPEERVFRALRFPALPAALSAIRRTLQAGIFPAAVRLYDELDTLLHKGGGSGEGEEKKGGFLAGIGAGLGLGALMSGASEKMIGLAYSQRRHVDALLARVGKGCLLVTTYEGASGVSSAEEAAARRIMLAEGATDEGEGPAKHWWEHRYDISYRQSKVMEEGAWVDTIEVSTSWSKLLELYTTMRAAILEHALVMAHFSHAYTDGCSIYFTVVGIAGGAEANVALYDRTWETAMDACRSVGATITHHHGVGRLKHRHFHEERGAAGVAVLRGMKAAFDPDGILNTGVLGL